MYQINDAGRMGLSQTRSYTVNIEDNPHPETLSNYADAVTLCRDAQELGTQVAQMDDKVAEDGTLLDQDPRPNRILRTTPAPELTGLTPRPRQMQLAAAVDPAHPSQPRLQHLLVRSDDGDSLSERTYSNGRLESLHERRFLAGGEQEDVQLYCSPDGTITVVETLLPPSP